MPSLRSNKNKWHIPPYPPPEGIRCISVPVPDDPQWIALFYGAIYRLSQQIWYDRDAEHTAKDVAAVWQDIYLQTIKGESECAMPNDCCPLRRNPVTGRYEQSNDGGLTWFAVDDGPWVDSLVDGSVYWPDPKQRTGDEQVIRCDAAWAAANVLQSFYQQTVGALLTSTVGGVIGIARYLANLAEVLSGIAIGAEMIDIAGELFEQSSFFVDGGFPDTDLPTLRDILFCNSTVTGGAVTFDFDAVEAEIGAISGTPWDGLSLLLALYLNEDGLNAAGNIDFDSGDCSSAPCLFCQDYTNEFTTGFEGAFIADNTFPQIYSGVNETRGYGFWSSSLEAVEAQLNSGVYKFDLVVPVDPTCQVEELRYNVGRVPGGGNFYILQLLDASKTVLQQRAQSSLGQGIQTFTWDVSMSGVSYVRYAQISASVSVYVYAMSIIYA